MEAPVRKCPKCLGWGFWPLGDLCPIGEFDSQEFGDQVIKCPWCGFLPTKVKQILMISFGGVAILALIASFINTYFPLKALCLGIFILSVVIAMIIKERKEVIKRRLRKRRPNDKSISRR